MFVVFIRNNLLGYKNGAGGDADDRDVIKGGLGCPYLFIKSRL